MVSLVLLALLGQSPAARAPEPAVDFDHWQTMVQGPQFETDGPLIRLTGTKRGWTRSAETYLDGIVRMKFRLATPDADGFVLVRAMVPDPDRDGWPSSGYRIGLHGAGGTKEAAGTLDAIFTRKQTPPVSSATPIADIAWHDLEVWTIRDHVIVRIDGKTTADLQGLEPGAGYVGLLHNSGALEFKDLSMAEIAVPYGPRTVDAAKEIQQRKDPAFKAVKLLKKEKPVYSIGAMKRRVQGVTALEVVVDETGHVSDERVTKPLDRELDMATIGAARHWVFSPATQHGLPIPLVVTIEMTFNLH